MDQNMIKHEEEEKQSLMSDSINREYEINYTYEEDQDPLSMQDPIPISFGIIKKEEKDIKKEKDMKEEDLSQDEEDTVDSQHATSDDECDDSENTRFTDLFQNDIANNSQNTEKKIFRQGKQNSSVSSSFLQIHGKDFEESLDSNRKLNINNNLKKYNCDDCYKRYSGRQELIDHIKAMHLGVRDYKCKKCNKMYFWASSLIKHFCSVPKTYERYKNQGHHKRFSQPIEQNGRVFRERKFVCHDCNHKFLEFSALKNHIKAVHVEISHNKRAKYNKICFWSPEAKKHNSSTQENFEKYECQVCRKQFSNLRNLKQHCAIHINNKFECDDCSEKFFGISEVNSKKVHCNGVSKNINKRLNFYKEKKYACGQCDMRYFHISDVDRHIRGVHSGVGSYKCVKCNEVFIQAYELKIHTWNIHENLNCKLHNNVYKFECQVCNKEFLNPAKLKRHSLVHKGKKFVCEVCNMRFVEIFDLKNHITAAHCAQGSETVNEKFYIHSNDKIYACASCDERYSWIHELRKHVREVHLGRSNFKCVKCSNVYSRSYNLVRHTCPKTHECQFCNKEFSNLGNLKLHEKFVHRQEKFVCNDCSMSFVEFFDLKNHIKAVHCERETEITNETLNIYSYDTPSNDQRCVCRYCGEKFDFSNIKNHVNNVHFEEKMYVCDDCNKKYFSHHTVKCHIEAVHLGTRTYKCKQCDRRFFSPSGIYYHLKAVHSKTLQRTRGYKCKQCCKTFSQVSELKSHITSNEHKYKNMKLQKTTNIELNFHQTCKMYACGDCDNKYSDVGELKSHITVEHFGSNCYKCAECNNVTFSQSFHLTRHINSKHKYKDYNFQEIDRKYICAHCDQRYSRLKYLTFHIEGVHLGISDYKCEQCHKTYSCSKALKKHIGTEGHKNFEKFKCDICSKNFSQFCNLKRHVGVHISTKKYVCEHCGKKFITGNNLRAHINAVHNKFRDFECEVCKKTFQFLHHLRSHIICVHEKLKNFVCEQCGDRFLLAHHLRNHVNHIHRGIERNSRTINYYNKLVGV